MNKQRLMSIDILRGLVIVIMALDHVRDMLTAPILDFSNAEPALFFTRWITHLCAPTFVLLAGVSAFLYGSKVRTTSDLSRFLVSRGIWLVFVELVVVNLAWNFNIGANFMPVLQVIWAIGMSMIALSIFVWLPHRAIALIGVAMILGHNLLDTVQPAVESASIPWLILHIQGLLSVGDTPIIYVLYPLIPWLGVMAIGYAIGPIFLVANSGRPRALVWSGLLMIVAFLVLRIVGLYGEPNAWQPHESLTMTLVDFFDTTKYPPSLQFLLMTLGPALMLLGLFEKCQGKIIDALAIIGRVPFFFYIVHLYVIHTIALGVGVWQGFAVADIAVHFVAYPSGFGISLGAVYVFWLAVVALLYPACRWFAAVKRRSAKWWLSYL